MICQPLRRRISLALSPVTDLVGRPNRSSKNQPAAAAVQRNSIRPVFGAMWHAARYEEGAVSSPLTQLRG